MVHSEHRLVQLPFLLGRVCLRRSELDNQDGWSLPPRGRPSRNTTLLAVSQCGRRERARRKKAALLQVEHGVVRV